MPLIASSLAKFLPSTAMLNGGKFCVSRLIVSSSALAEAKGKRVISAPSKARRRYLLLVGMLKSRVDRTLFFRTGISPGGCRQIVVWPAAVRDKRPRGDGP